MSLAASSEAIGAVSELLKVQLAARTGINAVAVGRPEDASKAAGPSQVRIVKGANLSMERVDAEIHGWELTTWPSKQATDTNYKRMLLAALTPEATEAVRIGVAGHNLFDLAWAWLLAQRICGTCSGVHA